jgi:hypothetical protein
MAEKMHITTPARNGIKPGPGAPSLPRSNRGAYRRTNRPRRKSIALLVKSWVLITYPFIEVH